MRDLYLPHDPVYAPHSDELITKQEFKDECEIYNILKQYQRTGIIQHINSKQPIFEDLPDEYDFQSSMNTILRAEEAFAALPSSIRDSYDNDPQRFLAALTDPAQADKLIELGVLKPKAAPRPADPNPTGAPTEPVTSPSS